MPRATLPIAPLLDGVSRDALNQQGKLIVGGSALNEPLMQVHKLVFPSLGKVSSAFLDGTMNERKATYRFKEPPKAPANNLGLLMQRRGFDKTELAAASDIPLRTIQNYIDLSRKINQISLEKLARALKVIPSDIFPIDGNFTDGKVMNINSKLFEMGLANKEESLGTRVPYMVVSGKGGSAIVENDTDKKTAPPLVGHSSRTVAAVLVDDVLGLGEGAVIYWKKPFVKCRDSFIGQLCVLQLESGALVLRIVRKGLSKGQYDLFDKRSNATIRANDVKASPVIWIATRFGAKI